MTVDAQVLACWRANYGLDRAPHDLHAFWQATGAPPGAVVALQAAVEEIDRLRARILELEAAHEDASGAILQAVADERERCAKLCDSAADAAWAWWDARADPADQGAAQKAEELAAAIRTEPR